MIELESQVQMVAMSILFGMLFANLLSFILITFKEVHLLKSVMIFLLFNFSAVCYYCFLFQINNGILNVYLAIALIFGYYLHHKFYDKYFSCLYKYLFLKIHAKIETRKARIREWKERLKKKTRKEKLIE